MPSLSSIGLNVVSRSADIFLPCPFSLVVNLNESKELIRDLITDLPKKFKESHDNNSALGAALQAAYKLMVSRDCCCLL